MNHCDSDDEHALACAGITLLGNRPRGEPPQWHEISAWRAGTLDEDRAAQVLSHIANDPTCFQQWQDLSQAALYLAEEVEEPTQLSAHDSQTMHEAGDSNASASVERTSSRHEAGQMPDHAIGSRQADTSSEDGPGAPLVGQTEPARRPHAGDNSTIGSRIAQWLRNAVDRPLPVYAGAMAAILLAVLIAPLLRQAEPDLHAQLLDGYRIYQDDIGGLTAIPPIRRQTRQLGGLFDTLSDAEIERGHFQYGMRLSADALGAESIDGWQDWLSELPESAMDCAKAVHVDECENNRQAFTSLGQWALLAWAACQPQAREALLETSFWPSQYALHEQLRLSVSRVDGSILSQPLTPLTPDTPDTLCQQAESLLAVGF